MSGALDGALAGAGTGAVGIVIFGGNPLLTGFASNIAGQKIGSPGKKIDLVEAGISGLCAGFGNLIGQGGVIGMRIGNPQSLGAQTVIALMEGNFAGAGALAVNQHAKGD